MKIDIAHTYAIAGYGKDDLASSLIFLSVRCGIFGAGSFELQLESAWQVFKGWCMANKKYSTILEFSKRELKITSFLHCNSKVFFYEPPLQDFGSTFQVAALRGVSYEIGDFSQGFKITHVVWGKDPTLQWWGLGWKTFWTISIWIKSQPLSGIFECFNILTPTSLYLKFGFQLLGSKTFP